MKAILRYQDLRDILVEDCGESLIEITPPIQCAPINDDMHPFTETRMLVRASVARKLHAAQAALTAQDPDAQLRIVYAYRHPSIQKKYYQSVFQKLKNDSPNASEDSIREQAHLLIAVPEVAGHPTGAAVDVTISKNGIDLDMGTRIWDLDATELIPTFSSKISSEQQKNRTLLRELLMKQEFAPFDGEWWHFSYGDREWAAYHQLPYAIYGEISLEQSK